MSDDPSRAKERQFTHVVLADAHHVARTAVKALLDGVGGLKVIAEVLHANELNQDYLLSHANVVVVDLALPGGGGASIVREVKRRAPKVRVVVHTIYPVEQFGRRALRYGASGFVSKSAPAETLLEVVHGVFENTRTVQRILAGDGLHHRLSAPELAALLRWCETESISEIAASMNVDEDHVKQWQMRGCAQLRVTGRAEAIAYLRDVKLID